MSEDKSLIHQTSSTPTSQLTQQLLPGLQTPEGGSNAYILIQHTHRLLLDGRSNTQKTTLVSHVYYKARLALCLVSCCGLSQSESSPTVTSTSAPEQMNKSVTDNIYTDQKPHCGGVKDHCSLPSALKGHE